MDASGVLAVTRRILIEAVYPGDPDTIFREACDLAEMKTAMAGLARYTGLPDRVVAEGDEFTVAVTMWGWLKMRDHHISVARLDPQARLLQSHERNPNVRRWDHSLSLHPHPEGALWRDEIMLEARGPGEWLTARFCRHVYRHRHRARRALRIETAITRL